MAEIIGINIHGYNGRPQMSVILDNGHFLRLGYHADHTVWAQQGRTNLRVPKSIRDLHEALAHLVGDDVCIRESMGTSVT